MSRALAVDLDLVPALEVAAAQAAEVALVVDLDLIPVQIVGVKSQGRRARKKEKLKNLSNGNQMGAFMM